MLFKGESSKQNIPERQGDEVFKKQWFLGAKKNGSVEDMMPLSFINWTFYVISDT